MNQQSGRCPIRLRLNLQKIPDHGEDAEPLLEVSDVDRPVLIGVFDGMGGAGGQVYHTENGTRSGAYLAANQARNAVRDWLEEHGDSDADPPESLRKALRASLAQKLDEVRGDAPQSRLRSKMIRVLPTTGSLLLIEGTIPALRCRALWAGDSRGYVVTPDLGLAQLTDDHLRQPADAQRNLREDSPMSNAISVSEEFFIATKTMEFDQPAIFLTATDGCFGYLPSPASFEFVLLKTLAAAPDLDGWRRLLEDEIGAVAADDASMALAAFGWQRLEDVKQAFAGRLELIGELVRPIEQAQRRESEVRRELAGQRAQVAVEVATHDVEEAKATEDRRRAEADVASVETRLALAKLELSQKQLEAVHVQSRINGLPSAVNRDEQSLLRAKLGSIEDGIAGCLASVHQAEQDLQEKKAIIESLQPLMERPRPMASVDRIMLDKAETEVRAVADDVWAHYREKYERFLEQPPKHRREETAE